MIEFTDLSGFTFPLSEFPSQWLSSIIKAESKKLGNLVYVAVNSERILEINQQFLQHNYPTDIITFDQVRGSRINGEIYFCPQVIFQNAEDFEQSYSSEYLRVLAHGLLHLCGYGDKTEDEQQVMRQKENHYLKLLTI